MSEPPQCAVTQGRPLRAALDRAFVPPESAGLLSRVARSRLPILCLESYGPSFARLAAAVHAESRRDRLTLVDLRAVPQGLRAGLADAETAERATLAVDGIELLDRTAQGALLTSLDGDRLRLICATLVSIEELRDLCGPELFALASTFAVLAPALARRGPAIEEVAIARIERLCMDLERHPAHLSPAAVAALATHSWPGDLAELDAVLARTLLATDAEILEPPDLRWTPQPAAPSRPASHPHRAPGGAPSAEVPPPAALGAPPSPELASAAAGPPGFAPEATEALALELAHQLKNPLVTVKTFVQSVAHLSLDPVELARFRELTEEAVERMDAALEELLGFARLPLAKMASVDALELLRAALRHAWGSFLDKEVTVTGPDGARLAVCTDPEHLRIAFAVLARHVLESIEPRTALDISIDPAGTITLTYREAGAATHLRGVAGQGRDGLPLALLLVRGALARAGSGLAVDYDRRRVQIALRFATAEAA